MVQEFEHRLAVWLDNLEFIHAYNQKHTSHWVRPRPDAITLSFRTAAPAVDTPLPEAPGPFTLQTHGLCIPSLSGAADSDATRALAVPARITAPSALSVAQVLSQQPKIACD